MIDPDADRPVYKQLADIVRRDIQRGRPAAGQRLPSELDYVQRYGISRDSVRRAMAVLRGEGLVSTTSRGSRVRGEGEREVLRIGPGVTVTARMPTEPERRRLGMEPGVPVLVVERDGGPAEVLPADRWAVVSTAEGG